MNTSNNQTGGPKKSGNRRRYDEEFKHKILELLDDGRSVLSLEASFGVDRSTIYSWKKQRRRGQLDEAASQVDEQVRALRKEVQRLRLERDILKKALSIVSRE